MIKNIIKKVYNILFSRFCVYNTYSQAGEDAVLTFLFQDKKINKINYLDIGTNIPNFGNNTYLFYKRGNTGVCVEADQTMIPLIKKIRPKDVIINVGVAVSELKDADFYIFENKGLNTFDKKEVEIRQQSGNIKYERIVSVPLIKINDLIKDNFLKYPDLLSIDIEGLDFDVLKSLDFEKYPIPVICVETCQYSENHIRPKDQTIINYLLTKNYMVYADTYINTILVQKHWFYN